MHATAHTDKAVDSSSASNALCNYKEKRASRIYHIFLGGQEIKHTVCIAFEIKWKYNLRQYIIQNAAFNKASNLIPRQ